MILPPGVAYIIIPGWFIWAAGLGPFAGAVIARRMRWEPLWWISITLLAQFYALTMTWDAFTHAWRPFFLSGAVMTAVAALWLGSWALRRMIRRRQADLTSKESCITVVTEDDRLGPT